MSEVADLIVLGAGSGGLAAALHAAELGARVMLFEPRELGGTCVHRGCIPKKAMWYAAQCAQSQAFAAAIGFELAQTRLDWQRFRDVRMRYTHGIGQRYAEKLRDAGVRIVASPARLTAAGVVTTTRGDRHRARHVLIATGARPRIPGVAGAALGITSDDIFALDAAPRRIGIVGGGYVAIEFACILHALGCEVELLARARLLPHFDIELVEELAQQMQGHGIRIVRPVEVAAVEGGPGAVCLHDEDGLCHGPYDALLWAVGRVPNSDGLGLDELGVARDGHGRIRTDPWQNTNVPGVLAIGDVADGIPLTPVAVAAGRALAQRLYGGSAEARFDDTAVPSVVFAQPPLGMVGLTEAQARRQHGDEVHVHAGHFIALQHRLVGCDERSAIKLVCVGDTERVVGIHVLGPGTDELLQGFAVALRQGITYAELRAATALHPTAAEELLLLS